MTLIMQFIIIIIIITVVFVYWNCFCTAFM